jgi:hypothetical protein
VQPGGKLLAYKQHLARALIKSYDDNTFTSIYDKEQQKTRLGRRLELSRQLKDSRMK